ncbi:MULTISPECIES: hypothetical protein [Roseateles]|uniref:hypothetical protein n=1 Tax=Roseateles TaxID=93681 RepID=UPI001495290F|nr:MULTISPECIES: hypothetical protein [Roseateles]WIV99465.1 hypothetical protein K9V56_008285 [Paucibacter aquatile]
MTLQQVSQVIRWLRLHARDHRLEAQAWDVILTVWLLGWAGLPPSLLLHEWQWLPLCLLGFLMPSLYAHLRRQLHRRGQLRCDWLTAL